MKLSLEAGDQVTIRAREDIAKGDVVGTIRRPFNATTGQWTLEGKFIVDRNRGPAE